MSLNAISSNFLGLTGAGRLIGGGAGKIPIGLGFAGQQQPSGENLNKFGANHQAGVSNLPYELCENIALGADAVYTKVHGREGYTGAGVNLVC